VTRKLSSLTVRCGVAVLAVSVFLSGSTFAQGTDYDRYAPELRKSETPSGAANIARHLLVYPFELLKWPTDRGMVMMEEYRLDKKFAWMMEKMKENGIDPYLNVMSFNNLGGGASIDLIRLGRLKTQLPDAVAQTWLYYDYSINFEAGAKIGLDRILDTGFRTYGSFKYEKRPEEHFFGIGPHTSRGDGYVYKLENTSLGYTFGYSPKPELGYDFNLSYKHVNIYGGRDGSMGQLRTGLFTDDRTPGIRGDELLGLGPEVTWDTRDAKENSIRGGLHRAAVNFNKGFDNSNGAMYMKYDAEISRYIRLWSDRRTLVLHAYGETNSEIPGYYIPFHQMPRLGGMGEYPRMCHTLRSYEFNRFTDASAFTYNMEYRYNIWKYREFKVDSTVFWDTGEVFRKISEFQLGDIRNSYGMGFRTSLANVSVLTVQLALGEEGAQFYVHSKTPF